MNNVEHQYLDLLSKCLVVGKKKRTRNGETLSLFGEYLSHDMRLGFPLLTTKKMAWSQIVTEFIWFVSGRTNVRWLMERGNDVWLGDIYERFNYFNGFVLTKKEFKEAILADWDFALEWGDIGKAYGYQYREGKDQIVEALELLEFEPFSRRNVVSLWVPEELDDMLLPPCMWSFQLSVRPDYTLDMLFNIRSSDMPLGLPFNLATSGLFMLMFCHYSGYTPGTIKWSIGDAHIYANQIDGVREQVEREILSPPSVKVNFPERMFVDGSEELMEEHFVLSDYNHAPAIKFPLSN